MVHVADVGRAPLTVCPLCLVLGHTGLCPAVPLGNAMMTFTRRDTMYIMAIF
jgi:hypothetical protein